MNCSFDTKESNGKIRLVVRSSEGSGEGEGEEEGEGGLYLNLDPPSSCRDP